MVESFYNINCSNLTVQIILRINSVSNTDGRCFTGMRCKPVGSVKDFHIRRKRTGQNFGIFTAGGNRQLVPVNIGNIVPGTEIRTAVDIIGCDNIQDLIILAELYTTKTRAVQELNLFPIISPCNNFFAIHGKFNLVYAVFIRCSGKHLRTGNISKIPAKIVFITAYTIGDKHITQFTVCICQAMNLITNSQLRIASLLTN